MDDCFNNFKVDGTTIKKLDSNLFRGQEINEVYLEIMKTLPTDHMAYDQVTTHSYYLLFINTRDSLSSLYSLF